MRNTAHAARNKWKGILLQLGVDRKYLTGKHGPCPMCKGRDRFRFDDKEGQGSYFCSGCGPGKGFDLVQKLKGWDFKTAATEIDKIVGNVRPDPVRPVPDPARQRDALNALWRSGKQVVEGDPVASYLAKRGLPLPDNASCVRFVERCPVPGGGVRPAMVALVASVDGKPANLHRTFLGPDGKADMDDPRATMPGTLPDGCAIRLSVPNERLGIAEGIETALAAKSKFGLPVWAAINATMLEKWQPPEGVKQVIVFGDNDASFTGAAAAYNLAKRLVREKRVAVDVSIPKLRNTDWADEAAL